MSMENRNLEKAIDIMTALLMGDNVGAKGNNAMLYEEYSHNTEVYDLLNQILKGLDLNLYEYNNSLFLSAGNSNKIFGYSNEELKRLMGLRLNRELFLTYLIMYCMIMEFYKDTSTGTYLEYLRIEDVIKLMDSVTSGYIDPMAGLKQEEITGENSFKSIALLWDELMTTGSDDGNGGRAARNSKAGYVKLTLNFLMSQKLFTEVEDRYYPTDRFRAIAKNYFEENRGALYGLFKGKENLNAAD